MSGSSMSYNHVSFIGCRVAGPATYTPAHIPVGGTKPIRQMATINVYQNINGKPSKFRLTAWGKMADVVAKSCAAGKELMIEAEAHSYKGKIPVPSVDPTAPLQFITGADGQPLQIEKTGFVIRRLLFGNDSEKQINFEIQNGMRPPLWNVPGQPDNNAWKEICGQRNAINFVQGSAQFGYANVRNPNGQVVDPATINNGTTVAAPVNTGTATVQQPAGFQGVNPNAQPAPATPAPATPVMVQGQNMGYQAAPAANTQAAPAGSGFSM